MRPEPRSSDIPADLPSVQGEITHLHAFFEGWFRGTLSKDGDDFEVLEQALADEFSMVTPSGVHVERASLVTGLREAHGTWAPEDRIWIEGVRVLEGEGDVVVAVYEEWQERDGRARGRRSTVVFRRDEAALHGLRWVHVHETWLASP